MKFKVLNALERAGFVVVRQRGSHVRIRKSLPKSSIHFMGKECVEVEQGSIVLVDFS